MTHSSLIKRAALLATLAALGGAAQAYTQDFESPEVFNLPLVGGNFSVLTASQFASNFTGWSSTGSVTLGEQYSLNNVLNPFDDTTAGQFLLVNGGTTVSFLYGGLTIGQTYDLNASFDFAGRRNGANQNAGTFTVSNGSPLTITTLTETTNSVATVNEYFGQLQGASPFSTTFTANATSVSFAFAALGNGSGPNASRLAIDNFSVTISAVPEPESYAMMLSGLAALGFLSRRRQRA